MTLAYYNEHDIHAAAWLRNLIAAGHIAPGVVDERDIRDVRPEELIGFTQCHFFAGIGIWSYALRQAGWPDDRPIWTGSCPCQPFSAAGRGGGVTDERHLWPHWHWLIEQCRPPVVLGEQVSSKAGLGWFDLVSADMEGAGYAIGASDLCAAGFSGAHLRQRLYFVGVADPLHAGRAERRTVAGSGQTSRLRATDRLDHPVQPRLERHAGDDGAAGRQGTDRPIAETSGSDGLAAIGVGQPCEKREQPGGQHGQQPSDGLGCSGTIRNPRQARSFDPANVDWLLCRNPTGEPSWRPVEPGTFPLAHGVTARMDKLRAYGNGLDAETATSFCEVIKEIIDDEYS